MVGYIFLFQKPDTENRHDLKKHHIPLQMQLFILNKQGFD